MALGANASTLNDTTPEDGVCGWSERNDAENNIDWDVRNNHNTGSG